MSATVRSLGAVLVAGLVLSVAVHAQTPDTLAAADRLIAVQDMDAMSRDMAKQMAAHLGDNVPQDKKDAFVAAMTDKGYVDRLKAFARDAMAKHFTVEELNALSDFYSKPIAKSAMAKMGAYTAELMPFVQQEMVGMLKPAAKPAP